MTYFNRGGDRFIGGTNYGRRDSNRGFDRGSDRPLFDATCAQCGSACKVPFRPNGQKEVFCSKCFETNGGGRTSRNDSRSYSDRGDQRYEKQLFSAVCDECGDNCKVPFEPRNGNPVLCSNCFAGKKTDRKFDHTEKTVDLKEVNEKLDRIIALLTPKTEKSKTEAILEEIEVNSGKKIAKSKKTK